MTFHNLAFFLEQEEYEDIIGLLFENSCEDSFKEHRNEVEHIYIIIFNRPVSRRPETDRTQLMFLTI